MTNLIQKSLERLKQFTFLTGIKNRNRISHEILTIRRRFNSVQAVVVIERCNFLR
jgi:hypothetical protein